MRSIGNLRSQVFALTLSLSSALSAQNNLGLATGNYAGISGAWLNPASIVDSRYKFDMTVLGYDAYFTNNYLLLKNNVLRDRLFRTPPYNSSREDALRDLLTPMDNAPTKVKGATMTEFQFPFSFMANVSDKAAIGLNIRNRSGIVTEGMDLTTAQLIYDNLGNTALFGLPMDNSGFRFSFLNWMEFGFTYGRVLVRTDHHMLKGAFTLKAMAGASSIHLKSDDLRITFDGQDTLSMDSRLIEYGRTERGDVDTYQRRNLLNGVEDWAFGWDAGLVYELRGNVARGRYLDLDNEEKERKELNKYILRVGVSLLDAGKFTFTRRELAQDHSANITAWDISQVNATDLDSWDAAYSELVNYVPNGSATYTHRLPTAWAANVDLHLFGGFYLNAGTYRDATRWFKETNSTLNTREWVAVTPRFENRWFGLYVPVSLSDEQLRVGTTVRVGPVYFGSNNLADQIVNPQNPQADYHFGLRFSIGQGKPTALKRKYEAWRTQQAGINRNSTRIDSLEREVYALKMVMQDRAASPTVINNFFGADSAAMALVRDSVMLRSLAGTNSTGMVDQLKAENEYLMQELARRSIDQRADSSYIARLEQTDDRKQQEQLKSERAANKAATKAASQQADATKAMADEMASIDKRMKRQNTILLAGGVAAVAAASNKKEEPPKGTAILVNDSTIVLGADTLRMVIPAGLAAPVGRGIGDTVRIVVRDTMRISETRVDTVRMLQRDTTIIERTIQPTGTITMAQAERDRAMRPVYFATGKTTLGPQGRMQVEELAAWLMKNPNERVEITGVADASGGVAVNERVAQARAESVRQLLLNNGVGPERIFTRRMLAPAGSSPDAKDRRADIRLVEPVNN
ncbi:MAG: OmpA family protein [Flavobacteriales bacterium]|nr:OmpA family protein [Flavobacteriales bacterium]